MTLPISARQLNGLIALSCIAGMAFALYLQYVENLEPCPLCMTQRVFISLVGLIGFLAFIHNPAITGQRIYACLGLVFGLLGAGFSGRQIWLQHLPPEQVPACGPSLQYMLETLPFADTLRIMITGDGNCAEITWTLFGLSIPMWVCAMFVGLIVCNLSLIRDKNFRKTTVN